MRLRWGLVIGAVVAAAGAHLIAARAVRGRALLGAGSFTREMAAALDEPGYEEVDQPLRVSFGTADSDSASARAPDSRPKLDPAPFRRPPDAGAKWGGLPGLTDRLAACAVELSREPDEERDAPRVPPPGPFHAEHPAHHAGSYPGGSQGRIAFRYCFCGQQPD